METGKEVAVRDPQQSLTLQKVADGLFKSGLFPNAKNVFGAFAIVEYGNELGIPPMMALKNINIISGQLACNGQLMLSLAMQKGVTYDVLREDDKGCQIVFHRHGAKDYTAEFNENDAKAAGLINKDNWKKYPKDMYFWRAAVKGIRRIAPDAATGLYTADEITEGKYINVIEIPPDKLENKIIDAETAPDRQEATPVPENAATATTAPSAGEIKLATKDQITKIQIMMKERGRTERADILDDLTGFCERPIKSSKELTFEEAHGWIEANLAA